VEVVGLIWNEVFLKPMTNGLVLLYVFLFHNFGLSIILFTVFIRVVTLPLTLRQLRQTKAMSEVSSKMQELQKKHGKDRQKLAQEQMRLYKERGVSPLGCLGPMLIQFPIWIALYYALIKALPVHPDSLVGLSQVLYPGLDILHSSVPIQSRFLWMDLAIPDPTPVLPLLVGASMWVQQKMTMLPGADPKQQQTNQMLLWMMPLMFMFFTFQFPSGLALYWVVSNVIGIGIQYFITGWGGLIPQRKPQPAVQPASEPQPAKELTSHGEQHRGNRQDGRGSDRAGAKAARRKEGGGGRRGT
jgi:YidC/Oxa1 family membrane protein insertase